MHERKKIKQRSSFAFLMRKLVEDEHKKRDPHQEGSEQQENCCAWKVKIPNAMNEYQPSHCHTALMRRSNLLDCFFSLSLSSLLLFSIIYWDVTIVLSLMIFIWRRKSHVLQPMRRCHLTIAYRRGFAANKIYCVKMMPVLGARTLHDESWLMREGYARLS